MRIAFEWTPARRARPHGQVLADQIRGADAAEIDSSEDEANRERLY